MMLNALTCQELVELATDYLEHALDASVRVRFEQHLAECSGCRTHLEHLQRTISAVGQLSTPLSDETRTALLSLFRDWKR